VIAGDDGLAVEFQERQFHGSEPVAMTMFVADKSATVSGSAFEFRVGR